MADLNALPTEIIRDTMSHLGRDLRHLNNYSLACRKLSEAARMELYKHIDLSHKHAYDGQTDAKTTQRQARLLCSLSENPSLAAHVRTFKTTQLEHFGKRNAVNYELDDSVLIGAAKNMKLLSRAVLTPSPISAHILANLQDYSQLTDLEVEALKLEEHVWALAPTTLTSLKWAANSSWPEDRPLWRIAQFLINVAEATCPNLKSLDISLPEFRGREPELPVVDPMRAELYQAPTCGKSSLPRLRHFGFHYQGSRPPSDHQEEFLRIAKRYRKSLQSVSFPIDCGSYTQGTLKFVLKICEILPELKSLSLTQTWSRGVQEAGSIMTGFEFFEALTTGLNDLGMEIERFSVTSIEAPFSAKIGKLFHSWKHLKFLFLGDIDHEHTIFGNNGRLDFIGYKPEVLAFIQSLPPSLEELYLEINGRDLSLDDEGDFDPMTELGIDIFTTLRRLHTCDIHAWITDTDGGLGPIPQNAILHRRLPHEEPVQYKDGEIVPSNKIKKLWTSRMDCIYQEEGVAVSKDLDVLELGPGEEFEGRDANEAWCDGLTSEGPTFTRRGREVDPDEEWPFWEGRAVRYEMFR